MRSPRGCHTLSVSLSLMALFNEAVMAQGVTVQQPVTQQFGVQTVVSVPDRGAVLLGSVGASAQATHRLGPIGPVSQLAHQTNHGGLWVHATIHDLAAMDAGLLSEAEPHSPTSPPLEGMAARAHDQLLRQHRQLVRDGSFPSQSGTRPQAATGSTLNRFGRSTLR